MPRRSSSGGGSRSRSYYPARSTPKPKPAARPSQPAQVNQSGGGLGAAVADGMAWGFGSSFGHRVMDAVMGPRTVRHETVETTAPQAAASQSVSSISGSDSCSVSAKAFHDCLHTNGSDISKCQFYMDMLSECQRNSGSSINA